MTHPDLLDLVRATLDPLRIAVLGSAAGGPVEIDAVADMMEVDRREVAEAIGSLRATGLLDEDAKLDVRVLRSLARDLPSDTGSLGTPVSGGPWSEEEAEILGRFFDGARLVRIPSSASKRRLVLERIALRFEPGRRYPERDVNFMIQLIHPDYAAVRRYLVDEGFLDRADGAYWRVGGRYEPLDEPEPIDDTDWTITTSIEGVQLRPYTWDMVDDLVAAADDERIPSFMGDQFPHPYRRDDAETWLELATKAEPPTQFAIVVDGTLTGGAGGFPGTGETTGTVEIGWWLNPGYWGRGIAAACATALVDEFLGRRGYMRVWAPVMDRNTASARVAERAGLRLEGTAPSVYLKRGVRYDQVNYGLTRAQWVAGR